MLHVPEYLFFSPNHRANRRLLQHPATSQGHMPLTTMAEHFQKTGEMPLETENCSETDMSNKALMIARQIEGHKEVMLVKTLGKKCKTKWWLPSGSEVLALMKGDSTEYMQIFPVPNKTHCWAHPSGCVLSQWPAPSGYIKKHNLVTPEEWRESRSPARVSQTLALMDESGVWASSESTARKRKRETSLSSSH